MTNICHKWAALDYATAASYSGSWVMLQPLILTASHKALAALDILSTSSLLSGFFTASCQLAQTVVQLLLSRLEPAPAALAERPAIADRQGFERQQLQQAPDKPFATRRQQQQQQQLATAPSAASAGAGMTAGEEVVIMLEHILEHLLPAVRHVNPATVATTPELHSSETCEAAAECFFHAAQLLLTVLAQGEPEAVAHHVAYVTDVACAFAEHVTGSIDHGFGPKSTMLKAVARANCPCSTCCARCCTSEL
jgi:hypothetical protein